MENELDKLREMLRREKIPFEDIKQEHTPEVIKHYDTEYNRMRFGENWIYDRNQIIYGRTSDHSWLFDGICQYGSYGAKQGLIETYGELGVDEKFNPRVMTAEEALTIIKKHWEGHKNDKSRKHRNMGI